MVHVGPPLPFLVLPCVQNRAFPRAWSPSPASPLVVVLRELSGTIFLHRSSASVARLPAVAPPPACAAPTCDRSSAPAASVERALLASGINFSVCFLLLLLGRLLHRQPCCSAPPSSPSAPSSPRLHRTEHPLGLGVQPRAPSLSNFIQIVVQ